MSVCARLRVCLTVCVLVCVCVCVCARESGSGRGVVSRRSTNLLFCGPEVFSARMDFSAPAEETSVCAFFIPAVGGGA